MPGVKSWPSRMKKWLKKAMLPVAEPRRGWPSSAQRICTWRRIVPSPNLSPCVIFSTMPVTDGSISELRMMSPTFRLAIAASCSACVPFLTAF